MKAHKLLLSLTLIILLLLAALVWFFPPNGDFRVENPFWNGLSTLDSKAKLTVINTFGSLPNNPKGTALLLVPYEQFSVSEIQQLKDFVSKGGNLVLLDDYGYGNEVLQGVGLRMRFTGAPLLDPLYDHRNKWLPVITDFAENPVANNVTTVVFNHATCLNDTSDATVIAYSSGFSFLDSNADGTWEGNEPIGPFPVVAYERLGQGYVVAVSDPSLMIDGMIGLGDNFQFLNNLAELQVANPKILVDQSHLPKASLDEAKATLTAVYGIASSPLGTLSLIAVLIAVSLNSLLRRGGKLGGRR